jgi:hypothetical protein
MAVSFPIDLDANLDAFVTAASNTAVVLDRLEPQVLEPGAKALGAASFFASGVGVGFPASEQGLAGISDVGWPVRGIAAILDPLADSILIGEILVGASPAQVGWSA